MHCIRLSLHRIKKPIISRRKNIINVNSYLLNKKRTFRTFKNNSLKEDDQLSNSYENIALKELFDITGITLTHNEIKEFHDVKSAEDLKEIINDQNLWMKLKLTPINKVKIKKLLSLTPNPLSNQRQRFLTSPSLDEIRSQDRSLSFPFDVPATDTNDIFALPFNLCSSRFNRIYDNILNGKDCMMIGSDYKGKTTAMHELRDLLVLKHKDILPLYIDLSVQKSRLMYDITKGIINALRSTCGDFDVYESLQKLPPNELIKKLVSDCALLKKKLVILIDHIEDVTWTKRMDILVDVLGMPRVHGQSSSKPYSVVISGTETLYNELLLYDSNWEVCIKETWNPTFQTSHIKVLADHIELTNGKLDSNDIKRIKELTSGHPWYVNRLLHEINEYAFNTSDPVKYAANKMIAQTHMNGIKKLEFDQSNVFELMFSKMCFSSKDDYLFEVCVNKLGWFIDYETSKGTVLSYSNPIIREAVIYNICKKYNDDLNEQKKIIVRMVDYKSSESMFKGWKRYLADTIDIQNPAILFLRYMRMVADMYALELNHSWPIGRNIISFTIQNNIYMNDIHRITYVGINYKNNKEKLIKKVLIPEAEKALSVGCSKVTIIINGRGKRDAIEMFGVELILFYEEEINE